MQSVEATGSTLDMVVCSCTLYLSGCDWLYCIYQRLCIVYLRQSKYSYPKAAGEVSQFYTLST